MSRARRPSPISQKWLHRCKTAIVEGNYDDLVECLWHKPSLSKGFEMINQDTFISFITLAEEFGNQEIIDLLKATKARVNDELYISESDRATILRQSQYQTSI